MVEVKQIHKNDWKVFSERAHLACFNESKDSSMDRIDFALIVEDGARMMGYLTCREHDSETLYWQYGGSFPGTRESSLTFVGYQAFVAWCKERYKRITTVIENENIVMLKMAMKVGFRIVGVRNFKGHVLLELVLEF